MIIVTYNSNDDNNDGADNDTNKIYINQYKWMYTWVFSLSLLAISMYMYLYIST
jgi:hypothetical protein